MVVGILTQNFCRGTQTRVSLYGAWIGILTKDIPNTADKGNQLSMEFRFNNPTLREVEAVVVLSMQ